MGESLNWETGYAVAMALQAGRPDEDLESLSLDTLLRWILALPHFDDDPELANEGILLDIFRIWLEEKLEGEIE